MEAFFERPRNSPLPDEELTRFAVLFYEENRDKFKYTDYTPKLSPQRFNGIMLTISNVMEKVKTPIYEKHKMLQMRDPSKHFNTQNMLLNDIPNGICSNEQKTKIFGKYYGQKYKQLSPPSHLSLADGPGDPTAEPLGKRTPSFLFATKMTELECSYGISFNKLVEYIHEIIKQERREESIQKREKVMMKKARNNERNRFEQAAKQLERKQFANRIKTQRLEERSRVSRPVPANTLLNFVSTPSRVNTVPAYTSAQIQANLDSVFNPAAGGQAGGRRRRHSTRKHKKRVQRTRRRHV